VNIPGPSLYSGPSACTADGGFWGSATYTDAACSSQNVAMVSNLLPATCVGGQLIECGTTRLPSAVQQMGGVFQFPDYMSCSGHRFSVKALPINKCVNSELLQCYFDPSSGQMVANHTTYMDHTGQGGCVGPALNQFAQSPPGADGYNSMGLPVGCYA